MRTSTVVQLNAADRRIVADLQAGQKTKAALAIDLIAMRLPHKVTLDIAEVLGIGRGIIDDVAGLFRYGALSLIEKVRTGQLTVSAAARQVYPQRQVSHAAYVERKRARRRAEQASADVVTLPTATLPTTDRLIDEMGASVIAACEAIVSLPRDEDVAAMLTTPTARGLLRRALQRLGGINAQLDL